MKVRAGNQPQDRHDARPHHTAIDPIARPDVGFQVRKAHLDLLPLIAGPFVLRRSRERTCDVSGRFVHVAWHFARRIGSRMRDGLKR